MIVTDIKKCVKNKSRVNVYLDDEFAFALYLETAIQQGIKKGSELSEKQAEEVRKADEEKYAFTVALRFIATKMRTRKEVSDKLKQKELSTQAIQAATVKLEEYGYLDDAEYARLYAKELGRKYGKHVICQKMKLRGLSDELIIKETDTLETSEALEELVQRYQRRFQSEDPHTKKQKIIRALMGKGFDYYDIKQALEGIEE